MTLWLHEQTRSLIADPLARFLGRPPRLLLADDDDEIRWALTDALKQAGFAVEEVTSSFELIDRFAEAVVSLESRPDVVVTDVHMPGYNAVNVISGLRDAGWHLPVVFISAFDDDMCRRRVRMLERTTLFQKPLQVEALVDAVEQLVWAWHQEEQAR